MLVLSIFISSCTFFSFTDTPTTQIYTLSLHDALPISRRRARVRIVSFGRGAADLLERHAALGRADQARPFGRRRGLLRDRKSTRLNSSHVEISYAVFCLKKKKKQTKIKATIHERTRKE